MGGGKLNCDTTYKQCYRVKTIDANEVCQPIVHKEYLDSYSAIKFSSRWQITNSQVTSKHLTQSRRRYGCRQVASHSINTIPTLISWNTKLNTTMYLWSNRCLRRSNLSVSLNNSWKSIWWQYFKIDFLSISFVNYK